ncbi:hypothetical protein SAMN04487948_103277 [Halogranum amylolyticum]|uniref:Uncharacterized protein n=2 Tax=Halogranum amylolyticum TaxID=660520 RepID=A0A1H8QSP9_9EURY|nr:hypothetical protein SAMN04487948_103277 [Halogranum amylolyticum]
MHLPPSTVASATPTRRSLLRATGLLSVGLLAGCSAIDSDPKPGSLLVVNNDDVAHTLRLDVRVGGETRRETVDVGAGEWGLRNELLTDPGTYEVTVTLDEGGDESDGENSGNDGATASATVELTRGSSGGVAGENLEVYIDEGGSLRAVARQYD